jgi:HlyD family secretion protein
VKAGDVVRRGQVLATLDPTFTQADLTALTTRGNAVRAETARTQAELDGTTPDPTTWGADATLQMTLYAQRMGKYSARMAEFDQKIVGYGTDITAAESNRALLTEQAAVVEEVQSMRGTLYESKIGSKLNYLSARVDRMRTERELAEATTHLSELRHELASARAERQLYADTWRQDLLESLVKLRAEAASVAESLAKATRLNELVELAAPEDAVVLEVARRSVGSVLQGGEPLVTLVPADAPLMADISIASGDIGYARVGDEAVVKVDAFPYQRHGFLRGRLRAIGQESVSNAPAAATSGGLFHRSQVTILDRSLKNLPDGVGLIPGMTVTAEIKVGSRSAISYFLYPILRSIHESMREP